MKYQNIIVVGTSHIAQQSLEDVEAIFKKENPDIICLELDKQRLYALLHKEKSRIRIRDIFKIGIKGYFFALLGAYAEKKLGSMVGVSPGSEMVLAAQIARKKKKKIALIDQDIRITLKKLSKKITWKEKWFFLVDIVKAVVFRKSEINFDLTTVPSKKIVDKLVRKVKKRYPSIYQVIIKERNYYMAKRLAEIKEQYGDKNIVAFVGAGHEEEIISIMKKIDKGLITYTFSVGL